MLRNVGTGVLVPPAKNMKKNKNSIEKRHTVSLRYRTESYGEVGRVEPCMTRCIRRSRGSGNARCWRSTLTKAACRLCSTGTASVGRVSRCHLFSALPRPLVATRRTHGAWIGPAMIPLRPSWRCRSTSTKWDGRSCFSWRQRSFCRCGSSRLLRMHPH